MEKTNSQKIQLGIFVIIGTLVFLAAIYFIGNKQNMFGNTSHLKAVFVNVNGLQPGNNVRYAGIDIGTVKEIEMIPQSFVNWNIAKSKSYVALYTGSSLYCAILKKITCVILCRHSAILKQALYFAHS